MEVKAILAVDVSGSMRGTKLSDSKKAVINFTEELPKNAKVGVVSFGGIGARDIQAPTSNPRKVKSEVGSLTAFGGTPMHAGLKRSFQLLEKVSKKQELGKAVTKKNGDSIRRARKVIVLSTDGLPTLGPKEDGIIELATRIKGEGINLVTVAIGDDADTNLLREIASSKEDFHKAEFSGELPAMYKDIATGITPKEG